MNEVRKIHWDEFLCSTYDWKYVKLIGTVKLSLYEIIHICTAVVDESEE